MSEAQNVTGSLQPLVNVWARCQFAATASKSWRKKRPARAHARANVSKKTKGTSEGEEWQVVQRALSGDAGALSTLFSSNREQLYRAAFSVLRNKDDAEDALQEGLLLACLNLPRFEGRARFSTWLTRIVFNAALMNRRKQRRHLLLSLDGIHSNHPLLNGPQAVDLRPTQEQALFSQEQKDMIESSAARLSPVLRSAFRLCHSQSLSTREAAGRLGISVNVMKSRSWRARQELGKILPARIAH